MKAISIKQPWANMIARGDKTIETRRWKTPHRGKLLIVSSKTPDIPPSGQALATCDLVGIHKMTDADQVGACCLLYDGAYAWVLRNIQPIEPFPVTGSLGLYEVGYECES